MRVARNIALGFLLSATALGQSPLGTAFTYQGQLKQAGIPVSDTADFQFTPFDAAVGGNQLAPVQTVSGVIVSGGLFTVTLDFGADLFNGDACWLQIRVRVPSGSGELMELSPRQPLTAAPYALSAVNLCLPFDASSAADGELFSIQRTAGTGRVAHFSLFTAESVSAVRIDSQGGNPALLVAGSGAATGGISASSKYRQAGGFYIDTPSNPYAALYAHTDGTGPAVHADGRLDVGSTDTTGAVDVFRSGVAASLVYLSSDAYGGIAGVNDVNRDQVAALQVDASAPQTNGELWLRGGQGATAVNVSGDWAGSANAWMQLLGADRDIRFNTDSPGDGSAVLPNDAINRLEIKDEPGVACINGFDLFELDGTVQDILSRTITVPASGYVLVIATAHADAWTGAPNAYMDVGVSDTSATFTATGRLRVNTPSAPFSLPATVHAIFPVNAGASTFYLVAQEWVGRWVVHARQLSLMYFPTAYGTVDPPSADGPTRPGPDSPLEPREAATGATLADADVAAEQAEARAFHIRRLESELAEMRAKMAELRALVQRELGARASPPPRLAPPSRRPTQEPDAGAE